MTEYVGENVKEHFFRKALRICVVTRAMIAWEQGQFASIFAAANFVRDIMTERVVFQTQTQTPDCAVMTNFP